MAGLSRAWVKGLRLSQPLVASRRPRFGPILWMNGGFLPFHPRFLAFFVDEMRCRGLSIPINRNRGEDANL